MTKEERLRRLLPSRGISVTLLGCTDPKTRGKRPELVYGVTRWNSEAKIVNTVQVASTILSMSKVIFFSLMLTIMRTFDPRKVALLYSDTGRRARLRGVRGLFKSPTSLQTACCSVPPT